MTGWITSRLLQNGVLKYKRREVEPMNTYEILTLLITFGLFLIALLTYIDKRK